MEEARVYSQDGPIRWRRRGYILTTDRFSRPGAYPRRPCRARLVHRAVTLRGSPRIAVTAKVDITAAQAAPRLCLRADPRGRGRGDTAGPLGPPLNPLRTPSGPPPDPRRRGSGDTFWGGAVRVERFARGRPGGLAGPGRGDGAGGLRSVAKNPKSARETLIE
eukprot:1179848-Prorocentrum_minimum.AAC.1